MINPWLCHTLMICVCLVVNNELVAEWVRDETHFHTFTPPLFHSGVLYL